MIYIVTLIYILICAFVFDFGRLKNPKLKNICYTLLLIWLICLSGFAYNVGADIPGYMRQYAEIGHHQFKTWEDLSYFDNRQPGWMLLNIVCSRIFSRFVLLQLVIAAFSNYVILSFIKIHTKYLFIGILLYCICSYLNFNFNNLRQTVAVAFFLIGYDSLQEKKWVKYYLCCICAFMFHSTAVICFIFPLFYLVKINYKTICFLLLVIFIPVVYIILSGGSSFIYDFLLNNQELVSSISNNDQLVNIYFGEKAMQYEGLNLFGIVAMIFFYTPLVLTIYGGYKHIINIPSISIILLLFALALNLLDFVIPIVFMRFAMYLDILYFCTLSDFALDYPRKRVSPRIVFTVFILSISLYRPITILFSVNPMSDMVFYRQFYPYYSVFNPQVDPKRNAYFGSYKE